MVRKALTGVAASVHLFGRSPSIWKVVHMPRGNVKGVLGRIATCALFASTLMVPGVALAVNVPDSVIYDSTATDHKNLNHMYSLDGIKYDVYKDSTCRTPAKAVGSTANAQLTLSYTAGANYAESGTLELEPGKYYIRENQQSCIDKGVAWNSEVIEVDVDSSNTEDNPAIANGRPLTDPVVKINADVDLLKRDKETGALSQGDGSLEGCVIRVAYFDKIYSNNSASNLLSHISEAKRVWYFRTDATGKVNIEHDTPLSSGPGSGWDGNGTWAASSPLYMANGRRVFLLGTYYIDEVAAPKGYDLLNNPQVCEFRMDNSNPASQTGAGTLTYLSENTPNPGKVTISKVDAEAKADGKGNICQGDTDHHAVFTITNASKNPIVFHDEYAPDAKGNLVGVGPGTTVPAGGAVPTKLVCTRQANGDWTSNTVMLPYGTYKVTEDDGGEGMLTDHDWSHTFTLHKQREVEDIKLEKENTPVRAGLKLTKVDSDTVAPSWLFVGGDVTVGQLIEEIATGQGNAKLDGAEFTIKNVSAGSVKVDGTWYDRNADVAKIVTYVTQTTTGKDIVVANTQSNLSLPYGTYEVRETKAPEGYNPITGLIGGEPVVVHPEEADNGSWYVTGWEIGEV